MLKIGKATKYYTLWDVTSELQYTTNQRGENLPFYNKVSFIYLQNLSLDLEKAVAKAKSKGVTELEPDEELFGRNRSWSRKEYIQKVYEPYQFRFGKYESTDIRDCEDSDYLRWYFRETSNEFASKRVIELEPTVYTMYDERIEKIEDVEKWLEQDILRDKLEKIIKTEGQIDLFVDRNIDDMGIVNIDGLSLFFKDKKEQYYNGYSYYIPSINGKGKRIKNKNVRFHISKQTKVMDWLMWEVDDIEILK